MNDLPETCCEFDPKDLILHLDMELPAETGAISPLVEKVMGMVTRMGCAAGKEFEVETAIREALANAIVHGCSEDARKMVQFCVACDQTRGMLIVVRDPGPGFDPAKLPSPLTGKSLFRSHGRGIYLINQLMDEVHLERGGTEIHMRVS
jgi:serine/threonine-protein kinase RsbW